MCLSFYDWYCDLPPSSPQTWGEQTDVPESADWYNSSFIIMWGSNVPQTRSPDPHFMTEVRYRGTKTVVISPDYSEASKFGDLWLNPKQGTDAALALAMGHVILKEWHLEGRSDYFDDYVRRYTDLPILVRLEQRDGRWVPGRTLRASDFAGALGQTHNPEWKTVCFDEGSGEPVVPQGSIGFRWGEDAGGKWNLESRDARDGREIKPCLSLIEGRDETVPVAFPYFGGGRQASQHWAHTEHEEILERQVPVRRVKLAGGEEARVATVFDLLCANYGIDRGLGGGNVAKSYDEDIPYTPAWQERITGVPRDRVIVVARQFADNAHKTRGRSMVILGAGLNHWYHMDMSYRGIINLLLLCGCCGQSGGGWAHYVGQEKLRPQTGWLPVAFALDWHRPPRQMNSTSFFYQHSSQWRYEKLKVQEILSPLADPGRFSGSLIDFNVRAERMGWLPSAPQLSRNPLALVREAEAQGLDPRDYVVRSLKEGSLSFASEDPDGPNNYPRNLFVWRSNLLGASGKGHEYFLNYLLGAESQHGVLGLDLGKGEGEQKPEEVLWRDKPVEGKLDLLVTLDFRMSTTCLYSDIVLPTATWYEKDDLNTSDMHPFIHPLSKAVDPAWESKSDWEIYQTIARKFSEVAVGHLGMEKDLVAVPLLHDSPAELAQPLEVRDWKKGECEPVPGKTMPVLALVERDYPNTYRKFTSLGPLLETLGNGGKGIAWDTKEEVKRLAALNRTVDEDGWVSSGRPRLDNPIAACETVLMLAPETNGEVALKAWAALSEVTGRDHTHLARSKQEEKIRFRDLLAQPRKIISSPTWSGLESEHVSYTSNYTNVHELIPWRTLSGRQQFYQDHPWMRAFGEALCVYRPPVDTKTIAPIKGHHPNGNPEIVLNFITPHQKWGIHSTYTDNLIMLTLSRGGPIIWISEVDAKKAGIRDNDWIEAYNVNGAITARAVVSQRIPESMAMMYHAQEKLVHTPGSEMTGRRGGIHNSVTRTVLKPTHMIGGYAQLSYGFNYYGTVGSNRDEFVIVRRMNKVEWGPNWEEILGTEFEHRSKDYNFEGVQKEIYGQFENTFMMYLPRLCEHCLNPSCLAACPSGAIYKREEDGIVLIDQERCRGWRMCVSGCPYKKIYYNWKSGKSEKCIFCYPRIEVGLPTVCSETCVGRIRYLSVILYDADRIEAAASVPDERDLYQAQLDVFLDPYDPGVIAEARRQGIPDNWLEAAQRSPVYKMAVEWKLAFPLHPEYRTLPMVWYIPPLSPIQAAADAGKIGQNGVFPDIESLRIPMRYLANLLTAGDEKPIVRALERMLAMRAYMRDKHVEGRINTEVLERVGLTEAQVNEMYRYLAIADFEDRFVIPTGKREYSKDIYDALSERGGCGFSFGAGCGGETRDADVFGGKPTTKRKYFPIRVEARRANER